MAFAAVVFSTMAVAVPRAQPPSPPSPVVAFLDVPYLPQTESLCGGAAAAMVMRYWGATGVSAETFAPLLDVRAAGIHGADLLRDLQVRGWDARSFVGDAPFVRARLDDRQPVIALIEDRPGAFHYVVVVAWANGRVVLHDSARAPFRVVNETAFERAWQKSDRWTLLVLPGTAIALTEPATAGSEAAVPHSPCDGLVAEAVRTVESGEQPAAIEMLNAAASLCPGDSAPSRELAGVYALKGAWPDAARHAAEAVRRNSSDEHAWRILATSSFVSGDTALALSAWNHVGEPLIDIVTVRGLEHTRYLAALSSMRLRTGGLLATEDLTAAMRRLSDLPAAQTSRVHYRPLQNGRAAVEAVVIERPRFPVSKAGFTAIALGAVSDRELSAAVANPTGAGDLVSASWRWWEHRRRLAASYSTPVATGGVLRADIFRDEQTYQGRGDRTLLREVRRGGRAALSDWTSRGFRWELGLGVDAWVDRGRTLGMTASIDQRYLRDRVSLNATAGALTGAFRAATFGTFGSWRSDTRNAGSVLLARAGAEFASGGAPRALWPGAGTGHARTVLLRGHPLLDDGVVTADVFGRQVYHASAEARRWLAPLLRVVRVAPAVFIDAARAQQRLDQGSAWHIDAGAGVRVSVPGSGVLRIDVGKGLRDGSAAFSVGWVR
ncbi:MAG: cysteine peptidase family C39 domain-containing protein [Vicinamibacterales bacterium]